MQRRVGGTSMIKEATSEVQNLCNQVKSSVETHIGKPLKVFTAKVFASQVVAGANYFVKVNIDDGFLHLRIYRDLEGNVLLHGVLENKAETDDIEYFEKNISLN